MEWRGKKEKKLKREITEVFILITEKRYEVHTVYVQYLRREMGPVQCIDKGKAGTAFLESRSITVDRADNIAKS